jgi:hypothetical protein
MNELEWIKAFLWSVCIFAAYYALEIYVFDGEFDIWALTLIPMGKEILWLGYKYVHILWRRKKRAFVVLKESKYEPFDFIWIVTSIVFIAYAEETMLKYAIPIAIVNLFLLFPVRKHQRYYFGKWDIENLTDWGQHIDIKDISSIEFETTTL